MAKQEYFLGAIVTTRAGEGPSASFHVIDGQQRLTTLFIMLACLREWAQQQVCGAGGGMYGSGPPLAGAMAPYAPCSNVRLNATACTAAALLLFPSSNGRVADMGGTSSHGPKLLSQTHTPPSSSPCA